MPEKSTPTPKWMQDHIEELAWVASYVQVKYPEIYAEAQEEYKFGTWLRRINGKAETDVAS